MHTTAAAKPKPGRTDERVAAALAAHPETTVAELAAIAGLGQSTVGKTLTRLAEQGSARRQPGGRDGGRRLPDRWSARTVAGPAAVPAAPAGKSTDGRLRPGELRRVVAELLAGCADPVTPTRLAAAAGGRSAGAVGNCLERLVAAGMAVRVSEHPKAYRPATVPTTATGHRAR